MKKTIRSLEAYLLAGLKNSVPLKFKVVMVLGGTLFLLTALILWVTTSTFLTDKEAYLSDYMSSQVNRVASLVDARIEKVLLVSKLVNLQGVSVLETYSKSLGIKKALLMKVSREGQIQAKESFLDEEGSVGHLLDQLGWDGVRFLTNSILIGMSSGHDLVVGSFMRSSQGGGSALVSVIQMDLHVPEIPEKFKVGLIDPLGDLFFSKHSHDQEISRVQFSDLIKTIPYESNFFGLKKWSFNHKRYLIGYHRLKFKDLVTLGLIEEKSVLSAIQGTILRSILIAISIFLISVGFIILSMRRLTVSLQAMAAVTEQLAQGVFSYRVKTTDLGNDEIGTLATSFNMMAEKIDSLMTEVASKIEAKYENEAMSIVNQSLIIQEGVSEKQVQISGLTLHSPTYGGDWWFYQKVNDYVILFISKTENRGYPAALITAVAKATLLNYVESVESSPTQSPRLSVLVGQLNTAIFTVGQGKLRLSCFASLLDTVSGQMEVFGASHPTPFLHRLEYENVPADPSLRFEPVSSKRHAPLGTKREMKVESEIVQLQPNDFLFWYTPGLLTVPNSIGGTWEIKNIYSALASSIDQLTGNALKVAEAMKSRIQEFYGLPSFSLSNDVTFVVASIPKGAVFKERDEVT
jgi:HAMP domain-containing protein